MDSHETKNGRITQPIDIAFDPRVEAARLRLRHSTDQADALEAIREIVANLLGSEEMAVFTVDRKKAVLWLMWSFGIDPVKHGMVDALSEPAMHQVLNGECYVHTADNKGTHKHDITAFVPIRFGNETVAVLSILKLLPQKHGLDANDIELLNTISHEAGRALCASEPKSEKSWS